MHSQREGILDGAGGDNGDRGGSWSFGPTLPIKGNAPLRWLKLLLGWPMRGSSTSSASEKPLRPTAYLDGLRGFAAFLVYIHHHQLWAHASLMNDDNAIFENAFGWQGNFRFATFYGIRNFFTGGHMAVATFYVISGYVLSAKPLALLQAGEHLKLGDNLASAFFRRWFRLYIPLIVTTLLYVTSWHVFGIWNPLCEPKSTYGEELWNWYVEFKNFSFLFKEGVIWLTYNTHLWSIPLEMRGSMITYIACLALSRATTKARHLCQIALMIYFMYIVDGYYGSLFIAGMMQCDLDLLSRKEQQYDGNGNGNGSSSSGFPKWMRRLEPYKTFIYYHLFAISMFLAGVPSQTAEVEKLRANPGWYWLSFLKPQAVFDPKWFYLFFAANMMVACVPRIWWLKRFFESRFCQYLGRISFSLYLVHGPVLAIFGDKIYAAVGWVRPVESSQIHMAHWINLFPLPKTGPMGLEIAFLVPHIIILPVTLWVADITTRMVDEPAVRFANWLYKRILGGPPEPKPEDAMALMRLA
ncbi:acyltransferase 3 [Diplogelasinospora grovesii]|uniref:Acyltransferase 3 n=1 Tax=Diplogelasinospora grovesii TaxID=303347 RepID=A0AAN6MZG7_9PEZI|nr:acyltransferase 3 [Diplogelasinospora grovesii]